ncbi:MAG: valine--tRNA ligase [Calditrichaceae bacterium]
MRKEIAKIYDPKTVEDKWYQYWLEKGYFNADVNTEKKPYVIVIPPPNVTAMLHIGHAFNNTIQDILIRYKRKQGFEALWLPGTDHAGIATQNVVEKQLAKENLTRHDLGREEFLERVWEWKAKHGSTIIRQLKKLGSSCDWRRERFTMDEGLSNAVKEIFIRLYEKGLIYKGKYIINWCPRCATALSDEEVEHKDSHGHLWHIKYGVKGEKNKYVIVATTRPETMLGDTAVAVNPKDERFKDLIGKKLILPLMDREIPVIADDFVDREFGTGCVKVTPAHDPNDFMMGQRHSLPQITVMNPDGTMSEMAGKYAGLDRFTARNQIVQDLTKLDLLEKIEKHRHNVGHCQRCGTIIEPYLSEQWFVKVKPLAEKALKVVEDGEIRLHPHERWFKTYKHWMENARDWCISRQLWWGHRIPVYYCNDCNEMIVAREMPQTCTKCGKTSFRQEDDVLDTWFSSWLWPFSTLGWPEEKAELKYFYPTDTLVTAPDIIFFWVARMIMAGLEVMDDVPFRDVVLNGIVRDANGRKMSKSLGNGIDPLEMIDLYSADAVRFTLIMLSSEGQDINLDRKNFEMGRNFSNKIWNAFRFLDMNIEKPDTNVSVYQDNFELADKWILSRFYQAVENTSRNLDQFRINDSLNSIYHFFWHDYCDWYLELIKPRLYKEDAEKDKNTALAVASFVMKGSMELLHPFVPFITEEIWQKLSDDDEQSIVISPWPESTAQMRDVSAEEKMDIIQEAIGSIRNLRAEMNVPLGKTIHVFVNGTAEAWRIIKENGLYFNSLAKVETIEKIPDNFDKNDAGTVVVKGIEFFIPMADLIDREKEKIRLEKELGRLTGLEKALNGKLQNKNFLEKAPEKVVLAEKEKLKNIQENLAKVKSNYEKFN